MRRNGLQQKMLDHMLAEGGCWTASGLAEALGLETEHASKVLVRLRVRGKVRSIGRHKREGQPGQPQLVYEVTP